MDANALPRVLLVEDDNLAAETFLEFLKGRPVEAEHVGTGAAALACLDAAPPEVLLLDLGLPDMNGREILRHVVDQGLPTSVIVITGQGSIKIAVEAMRAGAYDFMVKPFSLARLDVTLKNAIEHQHLTYLVETYERDFARDRYHGFIGASPAMRGVYQIVENAAPSKATVFITGESGTGKEVCAQAIHRSSPRHDRPFIAINCGAIPKELMESEIFGHTKGAYTGAASARDGAAKLADGGTLFLDEICDMDPALQTKLLRFAQTGTVQPVGSDSHFKVDVRLVCATNRDPLREVEAGRFREDLYYRLHVIPIHLPPLRERRDDILPLAAHFLTSFAAEEGKAFKRFSPETEAILRRYDWPGNVRQLQNVVRNVVVLHESDTATPAMLPAPLDGGAGAVTGPGSDAPGPPAAPSGGPRRGPAGPAIAAGGPVRPLWMIERDAIEAAIDRCQGSVLRAAALLGIDDSTIYRKRRRWAEEESKVQSRSEVPAPSKALH